MGKDIKLNSDEWRDLVFDDKNKAYGAYKLRQTSSKRHIVALFITFCFVISVVALPYGIRALIDTVKPKNEYLGGIDDQVKMAELEAEKEKEEEQVIPENTPPPPPPVKASIQFTAPVITEDEKVTDDNLLKTEDEVKKSSDQISFLTNAGSDDPDAQDPEVLLQRKAVTDTGDGEANKVFKVVEVMPSYPGGPGELMKFLSSNIKYPTIAAENGIEGRVVVQFVVGKDGSISKVRTVKSLDPSLDREAERVVRSMPKWIPGKQNSREVAVEYTLPVNFKLQK